MLFLLFLGSRIALLRAFSSTRFSFMTTMLAFRPLSPSRSAPVSHLCILHRDCSPESVRRLPRSLAVLLASECTAWKSQEGSREVRLIEVAPFPSHAMLDAMKIREMTEERDSDIAGFFVRPRGTITSPPSACFMSQGRQGSVREGPNGSRLGVCVTGKRRGYGKVSVGVI